VIGRGRGRTDRHGDRNVRRSAVCVGDGDGMNDARLSLRRYSEVR